VDQTYDLLFVAAIASFGILVFTIWIIRSFNIDKTTKIRQGEKKEQVKFSTLFKDPYTRLLSLFLIFSMGAAIFVDYTFYSATETMFPEEQDLNDFLSFFSGTVILMSFLIQSFLNDFLINKFGLRVSLMLMPLILILFTIGTIFSGHYYGYDIKTDQFILFFVFTATAKAFTASLKDALESPAFKLFFLPFNIKIRFDIQTRIEGVVNEFAKLAAGAIQIGLGLLVFFKLIHFAYFVVALAGVVIYLAGKLYNEYKVTLQKTLDRQRNELKDSGKRNEKNHPEILKKEIQLRDDQRVFNALRLLEVIDPLQFATSSTLSSPSVISSVLTLGKCSYKLNS
jgi:ATP/ADP translocase